MDLVALGWNETVAQAFAPYATAGLVPARVALEHKHAYVLVAECGELPGEVLGRLLQHGARAGLPAVGDWVAMEVRAGGKRASIHAVLPRRTRFSRRASGERDVEQVVAANIDTVFLVTGLDADFNLRRIERYLALARGSGADPVLVLNKSDACADTAARVALARTVVGEVAVHAISAARGDGVVELAPYLGRGRTVALLGSSGAGKSTLANQLLGTARQATNSVREDDRGRHTTTHRELLLLPSGALLIDTPGMRELQFWDQASGGLDIVFSDLTELALGCRFRDCRHESEPDCAVQAALASGALPRERFASFLKLRAEQEMRTSGGRTRPRNAPKVKGRRIMRG